jgi:hypothetical protein
MVVSYYRLHRREQFHLLDPRAQIGVIAMAADVWIVLQHTALVILKKEGCLFKQSQIIEI